MILPRIMHLLMRMTFRPTNCYRTGCTAIRRMNGMVLRSVKVVPGIARNRISVPSCGTVVTSESRLRWDYRPCWQSKNGTPRTVACLQGTHVPAKSLLRQSP
uniref:Putative secreted protein n=1 Tax=Anopheles darlingi TaxID=43151 RepID=A0A2M4DBS0_ANODA